MESSGDGYVFVIILNLSLFTFYLKEHFMFKQSFLLALFLSISISSLANNIHSTLAVAPINPSNWGYHYATVRVNKNMPEHFVGTGVQIPVSINDRIVLTVYAMNAKPRLSESCQHIQIQQEGMHELLFELQPDWLIHCRYTAL